MTTRVELASVRGGCRYCPGKGKNRNRDKKGIGYVDEDDIRNGDKGFRNGDKKGIGNGDNKKIGN